MTITTNAPSRKELVKAISAHLNIDAVYVGPPSFAYRVGDFTIARNGVVSAEGDADLAALRNMLVEKGYAEAEQETLEIHVPLDGMDGNALRNLVFLVKSKQYLLNRVTRHETFRITDNTVLALTDEAAASTETFYAALPADPEEMAGLSFSDGHATFAFPLDADGAKNRAYAELAAFMVIAAREATRVSWKERKPENEKYYFRCWLLRLGLTGQGGKESRKALLAGLNGHVAFKTKEGEERHKVKLAAKREAERAARSETGVETSTDEPEKALIA